MKRLKLVLFLLSLIMLTSCPPSYKQDFRFNNNSAADIYVYLGSVDRHLGGTLYPDTCVAEVRCGYLLKTGMSWYYKYSQDYDSSRETDTFSLFVFNADTFDIYNWNEIKNGYKILGRYDLSLKNFKDLNWEVSYPPDERMRGIKMYPPYGSPITTDTNKKE